MNEKLRKLEDNLRYIREENIAYPGDESEIQFLYEFIVENYNISNVCKLQSKLNGYTAFLFDAIVANDRIAKDYADNCALYLDNEMYNEENALEKYRVLQRKSLQNTIDALDRNLKETTKR